MASDVHYAESQRRENLVEHCVIAELLRDAWLRRDQMMDILRSEVDAAGYDLVLVCNGVTRHVQLKASVASSRTGYQGINAHLSDTPSGCVVWVRLHENRDVGQLNLEYWFYGNGPGEPLDDLRQLPRIKRTRANAEGFKAERANTHKVNKGKFDRLSGVADMSDRLFGAPI